MTQTDNVRNGGRGSDDFPASAESERLSEHHVHLRQFGHVVQPAHLQLRSSHQTARR